MVDQKARKRVMRAAVKARQSEKRERWGIEKGYQYLKEAKVGVSVL